MSITGSSIPELVLPTVLKPPESIRSFSAERPIAKTCTHSELFAVVFEVAAGFRSGKHAVEEHRDYIQRLKTDVFKVSAGSKGEQVTVPFISDGLQQSKRMRWNEFCETFFGVSTDWMARILNEPKKKRKKSEKPKHLTHLEFRLLETASSIHEALLDIEAQRWPEAIVKLQEHLPSKDAIAEHLDRGVAPTVLNPGGDCAGRGSEPDAPSRGSNTDPKSPGWPTKSYAEWERHELPDDFGYELKYFGKAHRYFVHDFNQLFRHVETRKILAMLDAPDSAKVQERSAEFTKLAVLVRSAANKLAILAEMMAQ